MMIRLPSNSICSTKIHRLLLFIPHKSNPEGASTDCCVKSSFFDNFRHNNIDHGTVPKSIAEAEQLDQLNNNNLWMDSVRLEMMNNRVAVETYNGEIADLTGYEEITGHMVFDVKLLENFKRKSRFCADGHKVETPPFLTYSTIIACDSVWILLMAAMLNGLDVQGADIQNAFFSAPRNREKHDWMRAGPEFGAKQGKVFIVVRAFYGLKSTSASFQAFMAAKLDEIGFKQIISGRSRCLASSNAEAKGSASHNSCFL